MVRGLANFGFRVWGLGPRVWHLKRGPWEATRFLNGFGCRGADDMNSSQLTNKHLCDNFKTVNLPHVGVGLV